MSPYPLTNFEILKYYQNVAQQSSKNEPKFNSVNSRNNLSKIKAEAYVINLDEMNPNKDGLFESSAF